ncbi:FecCD family ABC transporter permease [Paenibacillus protaetiae]|uniref:Iron ABC transporter permease n=1 Tax=Paenibacillus protaetiae TaxID=2509456 RepID=A0A4P6EXX5_9BACL|nr:iron ABC transporter permease [Paenibacillus protaetiae]QAY66609.1 iron ABC transporter permease [Paenibacillus protaetiae]
MVTSERQIRKEMKGKTRPVTASLVLLLGAAALILIFGLSVSVGAADIKLSTVWQAIFHYDTNNTQHVIIQELRIPRSAAAALVGAGLAVAGAIMQGMTRNPLADSGLLGLNAGAGLALAICIAMAPGMSYMFIMAMCFVGAAAGAGIVYGIGSLAKGGLTPIRLTLAGAAVSALFMAVSEGIQIAYKIGQDVAFWQAGGVAGTNWKQLAAVGPWMIAAIVGSIIISRSITLLSLGEEVAVSLGQKTGWVKAVGLLFVLILAGAGVSIAGPIAFVGLLIPHLSRFWVGVDYRWIIPCSAIVGGVFMMLADIAARLVNPPSESPVGALIAIIGVPFLLYIARKQKGEA